MKKVGSGKAESEKPKAESGKSKPLKVDVRKVTISSGTILQIKNHSNGTRDLVELTNVTVSLTGLKNGESGKLALSAILRDENNRWRRRCMGCCRRRWTELLIFHSLRT